MSLETKLIACMLATTLAACQSPPTPQPLLGTDVGAISTFPPLQTGGTASFKFIYIDETGALDPAYDCDVAISGGADTRTIRYNVFDTTVTGVVGSDGRQPDSDTEQQGNARVFGTLPPRGTLPQVGASWTIGLPAALAQQLLAETADGTSSTRPTFAGQVTGFLDLSSPADVVVARANISVKRWAARPSGISGSNGLQPGLVSVGVVDLAIGTAGTFTGIVPLRAAYFSDPGEVLSDTADWAAVAAGTHTTDLYCLTADDGVPPSLIAAIPDIAGAAYPQAFDTCTH